MEIILRQAVDNLGHPGDVVDVKAGYARNYLLPRGLAFLATTGNKKRIEQDRARLEDAENQRRASSRSSRTESSSRNNGSPVSRAKARITSISVSAAGRSLRRFLRKRSGRPG